jgi:PAS domain-containing protein
MSENDLEHEQLLRAHGEAERLLHEQKLQLDLALNSMTQGLCMYDADGRIILFNRRYVDMLNMPGVDLMGRSLLDVLRRRKAMGFFTDDPEVTFATIRATMQSGRTASLVRLSGDGRAMRIVD